MDLNELYNKAMAVLKDAYGRPSVGRAKTVTIGTQRRSIEKSKGAYDKYEYEENKFEDGSVHLIYYKSIIEGGKGRKPVDIYRKITEKEYKNLLYNSKINAKIFPIDEEDHFEDIYYVEIPAIKFKSGEKPPMKVYFTKISLSDVKALSEEDKKSVKLELVPTKDIYEKGVGVDFADFKYVQLYLKDQEAALKRRVRTSDKPGTEKDFEYEAEPEIDYDEPEPEVKAVPDIDPAIKKARMDAANFIYTGNHDRLLNNEDVEGFVKAVEDYTKDPVIIKQIVDYIVRTRLKPDSDAYKRIRTALIDKPSKPKTAPSVEKPAKPDAKKSEKPKQTFVAAPTQASKGKSVEYNSDEFIKANKPTIDKIKTYHSLVVSKYSSSKEKDDNQEMLTSRISLLVNNILRETRKVQKEQGLDEKDMTVLNKILSDIVNQFSKERDLAKMVLSQLGNLVNLKEMSATGGGAAPGTGATAIPGTGEGMATKYAFAGPGGTKATRKKGILIPKVMKEANIQYTSEKALSMIAQAEESKQKNEQMLKNYINTVMSLSFYDMLENRNKVEKALVIGKELNKRFLKIYEDLYDIGEKYYEEEGYSSANYKRASELASEYDTYQEIADSVADLVDSVELNLNQLYSNKEFMSIINS